MKQHGKSVKGGKEPGETTCQGPEVGRNQQRRFTWRGHGKLAEREGKGLGGRPGQLQQQGEEESIAFPLAQQPSWHCWALSRPGRPPSPELPCDISKEALLQKTSHSARVL